MKKLLLVVLAMVIMGFSTQVLSSFSLIDDIELSWSASVPAKANWIPNTETDMAGYNLYRTDGTRVKVNSSLIPHPPVLPYSFSFTVPDNSQGIATFVLTAVDTSGNESGDSNTAQFPFDVKPPAIPQGFGVTK